MAQSRGTSTPIPVRRALRDVGEHVQTWRKLRGLTAAQVADRAGISRDTLRAFESGAGTLSLDKALRVLRALGVMDTLVASVDPYASDVGRLRADEQLPQRVRTRRPGDGANA